MVPLVDCTPPRVLFLADGVSSTSPLDSRRVWLRLRSSSRYVQAWTECGDSAEDSPQSPPLPLGAVCGNSALEADRFAHGFYAAASRSIQWTSARDLKMEPSRGAGAQLLREAARAAAVWDFVSATEKSLRSCWSMVTALGEELCALPRLAFLNMLDHRLCSCGAARRRLRHGGLPHLLPGEVEALRAHCKTASMAAALEAVGASRDRMVLAAAELGMRGLCLTDHLERQILGCLAETAISSATFCESCHQRPATLIVMPRSKGKKPLTLRPGKEARFRRKVDAQRRTHPRSRWRLQRVCPFCRLRPLKLKERRTKRASLLGATQSWRRCVARLHATSASRPHGEKAR